MSWFSSGWTTAGDDNESLNGNDGHDDPYTRPDPYARTEGGTEDASSFAKQL